MASAMKVNWPTGDRLIAEYKEKYGGKTLLAFSRGKDAIATALAIRDKIEIIPVHYTPAPDLEFIEDSLQYYEKHLFHRRIIRMPHPVMLNLLSTDFFLQTLGHAEVLSSAQLDHFGHDEMRAMIIKQEGLDKNIWTAVGVRAADSPMRRMVMNKHGPMRPKNKSWFPIHDMNKAQLIELIQKSGISLPIDYWLWGRSFDGLDARFIIPMKKHLPRDYEKLKAWFPLMEVDIVRYELHTGEVIDGGIAQEVRKEARAPGGRRPKTD